MKMIRLILIFIFLGNAISFADCAGSGIYMWPSGSLLSVNSWITITGYANDQAFVSELTKKYPIYLVSAADKVPLEWVIKEDGGFKLTQVALKPSRLLIAGQSYKLIAENLKTDYDPFRIWNYSTGEVNAKTWTVLSSKDTLAPTWKQLPVIDSKEVELYGCGPARYVKFKCAVNDESEVLVRTKLKNLEKNTVTVYSVPIEDEILSIGHGMCSGGFYFQEGAKYEISFDLVDASGNMTPWSGKGIIFNAP